MIRTRLLGLADVKRRFAQAPADVSKKTLRRGASAGARAMKPVVIAETPQADRPHRKGVMPGLAKRAVIIKYARELSNDDQATFLVTYRQGKRAQRVGKRGANLDAYYVKYVERGHKIVPRSRRVGTDRRGRAINAVTKRERQRLAGENRVPGKFFFARAIARSQAAALHAMVDTMSDDLRQVFA